MIFVEGLKGDNATLRFWSQQPLPMFPLPWLQYFFFIFQCDFPGQMHAIAKLGNKGFHNHYTNGMMIYRSFQQNLLE